MRIELARLIVGVFIIAAGLFVAVAADKPYNGQWIVGIIIVLVGIGFALKGARHDPA